MHPSSAELAGIGIRVSESAGLDTAGNEAELEAMSLQLTRTFEELTLIHGLSCGMDVAQDRQTHCRVALERLAECLPVTTLAILLSEEAEESTADHGRADGHGTAKQPEGIGGASDRDRGAKDVVQIGEPMDICLLRRIAAELGEAGSAVRNYPLYCAPELTRVASVPIEHSTKRNSRLLAIGPSSIPELGTIEVRLMESVAMILKAHLEIHRQFDEMRQMFEGTVRALISAIDAKDQYTCGHSSRVSELAESLARDLGLPDSEVETVRMAGLLHDIGKIGVSDAVLQKPGALNKEEFAEIKKHPELGYRILCGIKQFESILPGVRYHHESWDGRGYPEGLAGEAIPRIARILGVADAFDAMTSTRPYRNGMPIEQVEAIFRQGRGKQWDAEVVDRLLENRPRMVRMMHLQFLGPLV
jgi:putative nucleotidyltransferase with HDIG domain